MKMMALKEESTDLKLPSFRFEWTMKHTPIPSSKHEIQGCHVVNSFFYLKVNSAVDDKNPHRNGTANHSKAVPGKPSVMSHLPFPSWFIHSCSESGFLKASSAFN